MLHGKSRGDEADLGGPSAGDSSYRRLETFSCTLHLSVRESSVATSVKGVWVDTAIDEGVPVCYLDGSHIVGLESVSEFLDSYVVHGNLFLTTRPNTSACAVGQYVNDASAILVEHPTRLDRVLTSVANYIQTSAARQNVVPVSGLLNHLSKVD